MISAVSLKFRGDHRAKPRIASQTRHDPSSASWIVTVMPGAPIEWIAGDVALLQQHATCNQVQLFVTSRDRANFVSVATLLRC
jgi:hypothetical protein